MTNAVDAYTTTELAKLLGIAPKNILARAVREGWIPVRRAKKLGGDKWQLYSMPKSTKAEIEAKHAVQQGAKFASKQAVEPVNKRTEGGLVPLGMAQEATEYWLPDDTYTTPARTMVTVGPLPKDPVDPDNPDYVRFARPEPTEAELCAMRIAEIKGELQTIDAAKVRPMSGIIEGTATEDEKARLAELNTQADELRAELQMLEMFA